MNGLFFSFFNSFLSEIADKKNLQSFPAPSVFFRPTSLLILHLCSKHDDDMFSRGYSDSSARYFIMKRALLTCPLLNLVLNHF